MKIFVLIMVGAIILAAISGATDLALAAVAILVIVMAIFGLKSMFKSNGRIKINKH